ncbi:MAG: hypothetical protein WKG01_04005 [Kofleriaceae bacterium]
MDRLIVVLALVGGCVPTSYSYTPSTRGEVARQPGPGGCEFTVLRAPPDESFEEVGTFDHYNGDLPRDEAAFKKAVASLVCDVGGHAVIVPSGFKTATVITYTRGFHL